MIKEKEKGKDKPNYSIVGHSVVPKNFRTGWHGGGEGRG
jgi:hypothetical protein